MPAEAERVWKLLNGIFCIYKPSGVSCKYLTFKIKNNLCKDLNSMETRPVKKYFEVRLSDTSVVTNVRPSFADSVLCVGPRYQPQDISLYIPAPLGDLTSGVIGIFESLNQLNFNYVMGINYGKKISEIFKKLNFTRCYHIKGVLGMATENFHIDEKVVAKAKFDHVDRQRFEKTLAFYQSVAQRRTFEEYGISLQSEEAYDFAVRGLYRPDKPGAPITYNIKLIEFHPPDFTIEVQCTHETEVYLMNLIHNLGVSLKSYAACKQLRCIRQGYFHVEQALLKKYWTSDHIANNIKICYKILQEDYPSKLMHLSTVNTLQNSVKNI